MSAQEQDPIRQETFDQFSLVIDEIKAGLKMVPGISGVYVESSKKNQPTIRLESYTDAKRQRILGIAIEDTESITELLLKDSAPFPTGFIDSRRDKDSKIAKIEMPGETVVRSIFYQVLSRPTKSFKQKSKPKFHRHELSHS